MVSIIISSVNPELLNTLTENIARSIGVPYEIIAFDNRGAAKGICQVYNEGIQKARYDLLCFMHEDIEILTDDWGKFITGIFNSDPAIGLLGIAGSSYKPLSPSGWHGFGIRHDYGNYIQSFKFSDKPPHHFFENPKNQKVEEVAVIDGVWLCATKKAAGEHKFDEHVFTGFHGYDIDFSLSVGRNYKVVVVFDLLINHISEGNYNSTWIEAIIRLHEKWNKHLPVCTEPIPVAERLYIEKTTFREFIHQLHQLKMDKSIAMKALINSEIWRLDKKLHLTILFYILRSRLNDALFRRNR